MEDDNDAWLWRKRFCHQSFYTLQDMKRGNFVKGLPQISEEPSTYTLAGKQKVWREAMQEEIFVILKNKTWSVVKPSMCIKPMGVKLVFQGKKDNIGKIVRYKARLVVKGYVQ